MLLRNFVYTLILECNWPLKKYHVHEAVVKKLPEFWKLECFYPISVKGRRHFFFFFFFWSGHHFSVWFHDKRWVGFCVWEILTFIYAFFLFISISFKYENFEIFIKYLAIQILRFFFFFWIVLYLLLVCICHVICWM